MNINWNLLNINKINLKSKKILFLGYGAVAKCVLNYFNYYFEFDLTKVYIIDKYEKAFYGPEQDQVPKSNKIVAKVQCENFDDYIDKIKLRKHDLIIDLTFDTNTYYFIKKCLDLDINYMNTSIEDGNDELAGSSIAYQHFHMREIYDEVKAKKKIGCNVLLECGQNPGLIQHYVIFALNEMNKKKHPNAKDIWELSKLKHVINDYMIGTILFSEIDYMYKTKDIYDTNSDILYNTWSAAGMLSEGLDSTELTYSRKNKYYKPQIPNKMVNKEKISLLENLTAKSKLPYNVLFLNEIGLNSNLNSICPALDSKGNLFYENFEGKLIHHDEMFDIAEELGTDAPLMTYVYKMNKYAEYSLQKIMRKSNHITPDDLTIRINSFNEKFLVFDNIDVKPADKLIGWDSVGCTIYCGKKNIDSIYWCGSLLSSSDPNVMEIFTPTIVQVAAGVLSGVSYIMEPENKNKGLLKPTDLYTPYILSKAVPLLGKFFFTEIPVKDFSKGGIKFEVDRLV
jgi:homospermidine synthase